MTVRYLELRFNDDNDGTGCLVAEARSGKFAGAGSAYFSIDQIEEFATKLQAFPIATSPRPEIRGGYWSKTDPSTLEAEHLALAVYPIDSRGHLVIQVRVMADWALGRAEAHFHAAFEVPIAYEALGRFARDLTALVHGTLTVARIESDADIR